MIHTELREMQRLLHALLRCDVFEGAVEVAYNPLLIADGVCAHTHAERAAIAPDPDTLQPAHRPVAIKLRTIRTTRSLIRETILLNVVLRQRLERGVAKHAHRSRICHQNAPIECSSVHPDHRVLVYAAKARFAGAQ